MECGHSIGLGRVDVGVLGNQRADCRAITLLHGIDETNVAAGGFEPGHRNERNQPGAAHTLETHHRHIIFTLRQATPQSELPLSDL